jgi:hypothetical protein
MKIRVLQYWSHPPPQQVAPRPPVYPQLAAPPRALQPTRVDFSCFNCGRTGHFTRDCPQSQQGFSPMAPSSPGSQQKVMIRPPSLRVGHANFTTVEEIPLGEEVFAGTFFLYEHPIIILFDSGASHDFMSLAYAQKAKLTLCATQVPYLINTPGGEWLPIRWFVKSHSSLSGECSQPVLSSWKAKGSMPFVV